MYLKTASAALFGLAMVAGPIQAQNVNANNLVSVQLNDALIEDVANDLDVNVSQVPVTVQVPIGIAANVCDVDANVLAQSTGDEGQTTCEAENTTTAFNNAVQKQLIEQ